MTKRRLLLLGLLFCLGLGAFFSYVCWFSPGGINRATVFRIKVGMTEEEVERLIGEPPHIVGEPPNRFLPGRPEIGRMSIWSDHSGSIVVQFNPDGTVDDRTFLPDSKTTFDRVCDWLGFK